MEIPETLGIPVRTPAFRATPPLMNTASFTPDRRASAATRTATDLQIPADGELSELTAHALGCHLLLPSARTVIDIGGQDAKVVSLDAQGRMASFVMNDPSNFYLPF